MIGWEDRSLQNFRGKTTCTAESAKFLNVWLLNIFSSIQQKIAQKDKKKYYFGSWFNEWLFMINLFNEFICYVLNQFLEIPFCGRNYDFQ